MEVAGRELNSLTTDVWGASLSTCPGLETQENPGLASDCKKADESAKCLQIKSDLLQTRADLFESGRGHRLWIKSNWRSIAITFC